MMLLLALGWTDIPEIPPLGPLDEAVTVSGPLTCRPSRVLPLPVIVTMSPLVEIVLNIGKAPVP